MSQINSIFPFKGPVLSLFSLLLLLASCSNRGDEQGQMGESGASNRSFNLDIFQDTTNIVGSVEGLSSPEAVRYDPDQDVYFVSNFNGESGERDGNGFISKVSPDGSIIELQFMTGTDSYPLNAPRGMYITGDTLWVNDVDGVHGFNRITGDQVKFVDFSSFDHGFLNDIVAESNGDLYVTDTGQSRLYRISNSEVTIAVDSLPHPPNGITLDSSGERLLICPWGGPRTFYAWVPADSELEEVRTLDTGGNYDGIEVVGDSWVISSQADSSIHVSGPVSGVAIKTSGRPADIGLDTQRMRVAVPYVALNKVEIWDLPVE